MSMFAGPSNPIACPSRPRNPYCQLLGAAVQCRREQLGFSIDRAAELAGLEAFLWFGLEAGEWIPEDAPTLRAIADALEGSYAQVSFLALVSRHHSR